MATSNQTPTANPPPPHHPQGGGNETAGSQRPSLKPSQPRVVMVRGVDSSLTSLSPFQRKEACDRLGKVVRCNSLRDGVWEVEFSNSTDAKRALNTAVLTYTKREAGHKKLVKMNVTIEPHKTKNFSKGVITCFDLKGVSEDEIVDGLAESGVVEARRVRRKEGGTFVDTNTVILTFDGTDLPSDVVVGYAKVQIRAYVPNPMRCFSCQQYGHTAKFCKRRRVCEKCGSAEHDSKDCDSQNLFCVNCEGDHAASDKNCTRMKSEKEILSIMVTKRIPFRAAKEAYEASHPRKSYAQVASAPVKTHATPRTTQDSTKMTPQQYLASLTVADFIRLAGSMGLVLSQGHTAPAPAPVATPPPPPPPATLAGGEASGAGAPPTPEPQIPAPAEGAGAEQDPAPVPPLEPETRTTPGPTLGADSETWNVAGRKGKSAPIAPPTENAVAAPPDPLPPSTPSSSSVAAVRRNFEQPRETVGTRGRSPVKRPAAGTPPDQPQASRPRSRGPSLDLGRGGASARSKPNPTGPGAGKKNQGVSITPWKG